MFAPILAAAVLAFGLASSPASAQSQVSPEQAEAARAVVAKSGVLASMNEAVPIFLDEGKRTFSLTRPELAGELDSVVKTLLPAFEKRSDELVEAVAEVYAARFTLQELKDISAFYDSPTGAKLAKTLPAVQQQSYDLIQSWSQQMSQEVVTRIRQEMKKRGFDI